MATTIQQSPSIGPVTGLNARSVGKKILMAITGLVAVSYLIGHMIGNLQIFIGPHQLNAYATMLHSMGAGLWIVRGILILFFGVHLWKGIQLKLENWKARPVRYAKNTTVQATLASRTMIWTGAVIISFLVYHILHYTARTVNPEYQTYLDSTGHTDVYRMVIEGFSNPVVSIFYIIAVGLTCFHLSHSFSSMFQSVGWTTPKTLKRLECFGAALSIVLFTGFSSVPVAVLMKLITIPMGGY